MTFNIGHVQGGTNAGVRIVRPRPKPWKCLCGEDHPGYLVNCVICHDHRPDVG